MAKVPDDLLATLHPLEIKVIPHLKDGILLSELCEHSQLQEVEAMRACQWLENKKAIAMEHLSSFEVTLDENGKKALEQGMPESRFLLAVKHGAKTNAQIADEAKLDAQEIGVSIGLLKKLGFIELTAENTVIATETGKKAEAVDDQLLLLRKLEEHTLDVAKLSKKESDALTKLKVRKQYIILKERKDRIIRLSEIGKELIKVDVKTLDYADRLTADDLKTGAWKDKKYRAYDVSVNVPRIPMGKEHFVQEAIDFINSIWIDMGFAEHEGDITQTAFWDLDALFVPQDHPARETQDTFYLEHPASGTIEKQAFERVRSAHENGGNTGSKGWQTPYSRTEASKLMLRTHDTVLSAITLWKIKNGQAKMPGKYFTVSRVFRNEKADWKHLFEFHQIGGIVVDPNANFAQLITYLKTFFAKMGFPKIRLRPHHFPYTEPSVEVDVWNPRSQCAGQLRYR